MDDFIKNESTKAEWNALQQREITRAKIVFDRLVEQYIREGKTDEAFKKIWYLQTGDKQGNNHLYNLVMSCSQGRKPSAGNAFESAIEKILTDIGITFMKQIYVDGHGEIYKKKPKDKSVHKHDCVIPLSENSTNIKDMIVLSIKTTLRDRYRQDLDSIGKCNKLIFVTKETPIKGAIDTITGYNCVIVYPHSEKTEYTWNYEYYLDFLKSLKK